MARDRFVYWKETVPTKEQLGEVLADFLGGFATELRWAHDRWIATLLGPSSYMFKRQAGAGQRDLDAPTERWIEVRPGGSEEDPHMDVITRMQDAATNALADAFAARCAAFWKGLYDRE